MTNIYLTLAHISDGSPTQSWHWYWVSALLSRNPEKSYHPASHSIFFSLSFLIQQFRNTCPSWISQFSRSVVPNSLLPHGLQQHQASLSLTNSRSLLKVMSIESVMPSNHLILCCPLLLPPSIFLSIRVFSNESVLCIRWLKYWSFSFSISPSNEYSGLISNLE